MNFWSYLSGKKTYLGLAAAFLYGGGLFLNLYEPNTTVEGWIAIWTGGSLIHKAVKG